MGTRAPSAGRLVVIAGFALSCFGLLLFLWLAFGGPIPLGPKGYRFEVSVPNAAQLADQADVRVAGVNVGKVVERRRDPAGNRQVATIELDSEYAPIRRDAKAMLRQKTLLGETYVEMTLGSPGAEPLPEDGRLGNAAVQEAVLFDELLQTFDEETRRNLQRWQRTMAQATEGRETDLNDALGNLPLFAESGQRLMEVLGRRREALQGVVRDTGTTFAAISRDADALQRMIVRSEQVFGTLAARRDALAESIRIFPTFLDESRVTLQRVETFGVDTEPLLRDLEPVLRDARPTLRSLAELGPDAERLFADLPALIAAGRQGLPALARVLRGLDPTLASVGPLLQQLNPVLEFLELYQATVSNFISIGASAIALKLTPPPGQNKTNGHALPQLIVTGTQSMPTLEQRSSDNRGNAYWAPDALLFTPTTARFRTPPSWDCNHVGGQRPPGGEGDPGCWVQWPVEFQGLSQRFPQVAESGPGGLTRRPSGR